MHNYNAPYLFWKFLYAYKVVDKNVSQKKDIWCEIAQAEMKDWPSEFIKSIFETKKKKGQSKKLQYGV